MTKQNASNDTCAGVETDLSSLALTLPWRSGRASPTGRRFLDLRGASEGLRRASRARESGLYLVSDDPRRFGRSEMRTVPLDWQFEQRDLEKIRRGYEPDTSEGRWKVVTGEDDGILRVQLVRAYTNEVTFVIDVIGDRAQALHHRVGSTLPALTARALVDGYLLGKPCVVPAPRRVGTDQLRLMTYGIAVAGSRCDGVEPAASRTWFVAGHEPERHGRRAAARAIEDRLPLEVEDEAAHARFRFGLARTFQAIVTMLQPDGPPAIREPGLAPGDAGLDHDDLATLRRWLEELEFMDESQIRRVAGQLGCSASPAWPDHEEPSPDVFFADVPRTRWIVWGRGRPRAEALASLAERPTEDAALAAVRGEDPRFALGRDGWAIALSASGDEVLALTQDDAVVRGFSCASSDGQPFPNAEERASAVGAGISDGRRSSWQPARENASPPAPRSFWVVEGTFAAGAYPFASGPGKARRVVDTLWDSKVRTFVSVADERERAGEAAPLPPYAPIVEELARASHERARCLSFPLARGAVPSAATMRTILDVIDLSIEARHPVYLHGCEGTGRTLTVVGCWLRRHKIARADDVLTWLARLRSTCAGAASLRGPETDEQIAMILDWSE